jgi:alpha-beta hydrolase superfamily lysophospholipase
VQAGDGAKATAAARRHDDGSAGADDDVDAAVELQRSDARIAFSLSEATPGGAGAVDLGARITRAKGTRGPGVVIVPGAGDVARDGVRKGDGVISYAAPVAVATAWAEAFAARGAVVLTWDKRTCGANDDPTCTTNPQADVDAAGPVALARDVDEACALLRRDPDFDGRLVLLAHGQAGQVALSSSCAASADAIVLLSPIPRAVDDVIVDALADRQRAAEAAARATTSPDEKSRAQAEAVRLKNLAGSRAASFASMRAGKFSDSARVDGATIAFWMGWRKLTEATASLVEPVKNKAIVVVGAADRQLSTVDRAAAAALPAKRAVVIDDADHHLLVREQLLPVVTEAVFSALDELLEHPGS